MKNIRKLALILIIFTLTFAPLYGAKGQQLTENMQTFFDHEIPGIKITVNATAETQPNENITVKIIINPLEEEVNIKYFNLSVFGFINGTYKTMIYNITVNNFPFNDTFTVPEQVWGVSYGEITLTYNVTYIIQQEYVQTKTTITYENLKVGFDMTRVKNVYLETVEEQLRNLNSIFEQLNQTFWQMFQMNLTEESLANLNETYWGLKGSSNELGNTRMAVGILAVTTVFFVATTLYLVMRKPKESW
jgi:hypothetical protein